jgi:lysozyme family protein
MANHMNYVPFCKKWEGGLSRDLNDSAKSFPCPTSYNGKTGWHTNKGVTYKTWVNFFGTKKDARFFSMSDEDWGVIFKAGYWDKIKGDLIIHQSIADVAVSWAWGSGSQTAIKQMQRTLGFSKANQDGVIGPMTLGAINSANEAQLFAKACDVRESFFRFITDPQNTSDPKLKIQYQNNKKNLQGWLNRLNQFKKLFAPKH